MKSCVYKIIVFAWMFSSLGLVSCEDTFLQKPETSGTVDEQEIYSNTKNAFAALMNVYREILSHGWPGDNDVGGALASMSGERSWGWNFEVTYSLSERGLSAEHGTDVYADNWTGIRKAFLVRENIHRVLDMNSEMKQYIRAEINALIAYRYMGMFYRYGGVPIVRQAYNPDDEIGIPRASLQETLDYVLELCDQAIDSLPHSWDSQFYGRFTKGAAMAIKSRVLQFAARPLFNSTNPVLSLSENNALISFGGVDANRWLKAIEANEAVLEWAAANGYELINTGGAGEGMPNPFENAVDDYGTATSTPGNREVLLAYKINEPTAISRVNNGSAYNTDSPWLTSKIGMRSNFMELYYLRDGTTPQWPQVGDDAPTPASDWIEKIPKMEARFRVDWIALGYSSLSNPGDNNWTVNVGLGKRVGNLQYENIFPDVASVGEANGMPSKFYYKAGRRVWMEPPLFRMAEFYLNLAEAYNETGNTAKALYHLNKVHNRAGLPAITETDQTKLRELIHREFDLEFNGENLRYFNLKAWKDPDIDNGKLGGPYRELQWQVLPYDSQTIESLVAYWDANVQHGYWHPRMYLEPFPRNEINKGYIIQNPGY